MDTLRTPKPQRFSTAILHLSKFCAQTPNHMHSFSTFDVCLAMNEVMIVPSSTSRISPCCRRDRRVAMAVFSLPNGGLNRDETLPPCRKEHMKSIGA
jgi:hypothetical protein